MALNKFYRLNASRPNGIEIYEKGLSCIHGSDSEPELELVAKELDKRWREKTQDSDIRVAYYYTPESDNIVFIVYTDPYSGMAQAVATVPVLKLMHDELDPNDIMPRFKVVWDDGSSLARKLAMNSGKRNYGGAYDIDPYEFFTKEDLVEFANEVCEDLSFNTSYNVEPTEVYLEDIEGHDAIHLEVEIDNNYAATAVVGIDMRRIRKPSDINKYKNEVLVNLIGDINEYAKMEGDV